MNKIYNHEKLVQHKRMAIPQNIQLGEMMTKLLDEVNPRLLKNVIAELKEEYKIGHNDTLNTKEKKDHVQMTLDKIAAGKYNFSKQNIDEGVKFNEFYEEAEIPLPPQEKKFKCDFCEDRAFTSNASLHSHYRSCKNKIEALSESDDIVGEFREGFKPVKRKETRQAKQKAKKVPVEIIKQEKIEVKKEQSEPEKEEKKQKREKAGSQYSFGSDIFFGDE